MYYSFDFILTERRHIIVFNIHKRYSNYSENIYKLYKYKEDLLDKIIVKEDLAFLPSINAWTPA